MHSKQHLVVSPKRRLKCLALSSLSFSIVPGLCAQSRLQSSTEPAPLIASNPFQPIPLPPVPELEVSSSSAENAELPEAPMPERNHGNAAVAGHQFGDPTPAPGTSLGQQIAVKTAFQIPYGWHTQPLTARDKVRAAFEDLYSVENLAAIGVVSGYSHLTNGEPNYGTNGAAFGQRLGAAAIRDSTQGLFTRAVFAPLLHEDARYYALGPGPKPLRRTLYAITRPLITRKDNGENTVNGALLLGYATAAALTPAYYPAINRNFHDTAAIYGTSLAGSAFDFFVREFANNVYYALHLRRTP